MTRRCSQLAVSSTSLKKTYGLQRLRSVTAIADFLPSLFALLALLILNLKMLGDKSLRPLFSCDPSKGKAFVVNLVQ